ncbi:conserved hypothetical protein [Streptococcus agalactiae COH1]|nr:conserved hypothetical protein [Streptococcus agalactiae COH1]
MDTVVFSEKDFLVNFLYKLLDNPTQIKVQKTLYLLFAFYGATYGNLDKDEDNEFSDQNYPKQLFKAILKRGDMDQLKQMSMQKKKVVPTPI